MVRTVVVAFGGNALSPRTGDGSHAEQLDRARAMARAAAGLVRRGDRLVLSHGNGPQVGNLALQQRAGADTVAEQPLFSLVSMTQGQIGHLMATSMTDELRGSGTPVAAVVTHVVVDPDDPEFGAPTKPVGPFYERDEAQALAKEHGWSVTAVSDAAYRRVVPSPAPRRILELESIRTLSVGGTVVIAAGGGGIPVVEGADGSLAGVDAVVDKDLAAASLATSLGGHALVLLTDVPGVALDFGTPQERRVERMTVDEASAHLADGQFPAGSMGPKVVAATEFVGGGGTFAVITDTDHLVAALEGDHGTRIVAS